MKVVFLVRHAKSSWKDTSLHDKERPLKKRGEKDLALLKPVLLQHALKPEFIYSSDAERASKTAKILAGFYDVKKKRIKFTEKLYVSSPHEILDFIRKRDDALHRIMIVGHNPDITQAADLLWEESLETILPTSAVICLGFDVDRWELMRENTGHMKFYEYPKKHKQEALKSTSMSTGN